MNIINENVLKIVFNLCRMENIICRNIVTTITNITTRDIIIYFHVLF